MDADPKDKDSIPEDTNDVARRWETLAEGLSPEEQQALAAVRSGEDEIVLPAALIGEESAEAATQAASTLAPNNESLAFQIREMTIPMRIKLAMFGNKEARALLIRDANRQVPLFVLENPRLSQDEVVEFSRNSNLDHSVFRAISQNGQWMKSPAIKMNLVSNLRVPIDVSVRWFRYLQDKDLKFLARSKNIPGVVATQARKLLEQREGKE